MTFNTPYELYDFLKNSIKYRQPKDENDPIISPSEVLDRKAGHCHEQTFLISKELTKMEIPNQKWFIYATTQNGNYVDGEGTTHSIVEFNYGGKVCVIENAWSKNKGFHKFNNADELDIFYSREFVNSLPRNITNCKWKRLKGHPGMALSDFCELNIK